MGKTLTIEKQEISKLYLTITDYGWRDIVDDKLFSEVALTFVKEKQEYIYDYTDFQNIVVEVNFIPYRVSGEWINEYIDQRVVACEIPIEWE